MPRRLLVDMESESERFGPRLVVMAHLDVGALAL